MAEITLMGKNTRTSGDLPATGSMAPDFELVNQDLQNVSLSACPDRQKLIYIVPSIDTPVCAKTSIQLSELAAKIPQAVFLTVSADLPFALKRFHGENKLENLAMLSLMHSRQFAFDYGVSIEDGPLQGLTARALLVLDENNRVLYSELVKEISEQPDFDKALDCLDSAAQA